MAAAPSLSEVYVARSRDARLAQMVVSICHQLLLLRSSSPATWLVTVQLAEHAEHDGSQVVSALLAEFQPYLIVAHKPHDSSLSRAQQGGSATSHAQPPVHPGHSTAAEAATAATVADSAMKATTTMPDTEASSGMQEPAMHCSRSTPAAGHDQVCRLADGGNNTGGQQDDVYSADRQGPGGCGSAVEETDADGEDRYGKCGIPVNTSSGKASEAAVRQHVPPLPSHSSFSVTLRVQDGVTATQLASIIHTVLHRWFPRQASLLPVTLQQQHIIRRDAVLRQSLPSIIPAPPNRHSAGHQDMFEMLQHVVGQGPGQPGACGLPYLYQLVWQPFDERKPWGNGQMAVWCTDGCGVWMAMILREVWLVRANSRRPAKQARQEAKRKEQRRATLQAALKQRHACIQQLGRDAAVVVFSAMCVSLVEGLEVVVPSKNITSKRLEQQVAQALIPALSIKQHASTAGAVADGVDGRHAAMRRQLPLTGAQQLQGHNTVRSSVLLLGAGAGVLIGIYMLRAASTSRQSGGARGWSWFA